MTEAGWYDDPLIPGGKRYWDGAQWTEHAQGPPAAGPGAPGFGPPQGGPPPFGPSGPAGPPVVASRGTGINDIGDWLGRTFKITAQQIGPLATFVLFQAAFFVVAYLLAHTAIADVAIFDDGDLTGLNGGLLLIAFGAAALGGLASAVSLLATHHNLYGAHVGQPPSVGQSFGVGFGRLLRFVGIMVVIYIAIYGVMLIGVGLVIGVAAAVGESGTGLIVLLAILLYLALFVFLAWVSVKLAFITVATAVVPRGTSALRAAWDVGRGFFWPILGRILLLGLIVGVMFTVPYVISVFVLPALLFSSFEFSDSGNLLVDGRRVQDLDVFIVGDFLPNPIATALIIGVLTVVFSLIQAVSYSGSAALYADLRGPNSFGHGTRWQQQ